jgi:hypothetical protein
MLPAHAVGRHRVLRRWWLRAFGHQQGGFNIVCIGRFGLTA